MERETLERMVEDKLNTYPLLYRAIKEKYQQIRKSDLHDYYVVAGLFVGAAVLYGYFCYEMLKGGEQ